MEKMVVDSSFWKKRRVLITGHSGFKGSWLVLLLNYLGADVCGYSLGFPSEPNLFALLDLEKNCETCWGDIRDERRFSDFLRDKEPEVLFHLAAQPLVRRSYKDPQETFSTNVMGTLNVLQATLAVPAVRSIVVVTTDKCYRNEEWVWGYRETDALGGHDPYSASKACAELLVDSWRASYRPLSAYEEHKVAIATARAGNVIGGGDWGEDRLIPDCVRALSLGESVILRNPSAVRPWQHVLDPLAGYLQLAEMLWKEPFLSSGVWNFGPNVSEDCTVYTLVHKFLSFWNDVNIITDMAQNQEMRETSYLRLDTSKANRFLKWTSSLSLNKSIEWCAEWYRSYLNDQDQGRHLTKKQTELFVEKMIGAGSFIN